MARGTHIIKGDLGMGVMRAQATQILSYVDDCQNFGARRSAPQPGPSRTSEALCLFFDDLRVRVKTQRPWEEPTVGALGDKRFRRRDPGVGNRRRCSGGGRAGGRAGALTLEGTCFDLFGAP